LSLYIDQVNRFQLKCYKFNWNRRFNFLPEPPGVESAKVTGKYPPFDSLI
jgi:hypothetical protein